MVKVDMTRLFVTRRRDTGELFRISVEGYTNYWSGMNDSNMKGQDIGRSS